MAAICAAPLVLHDAGLLAGRAHTAHDSTHGTLTEARADERVVRDGPLLTSRGAGTALDFALALVEHLRGPEEKGKGGPRGDGVSRKALTSDAGSPRLGRRSAMSGEWCAEGK